MKLVILYGSQTGTAADIASGIARQGRNRHFETVLSSMDEYDRGDLVNENLVLFIASTTGQGSEPDNMKKFWKFLLRKHPADVLSDLHFAVFGCGDSSYAKFNFPAKKLFKRLLQLGATPLIPRGDGDDQHDLGVDGALQPWLKNLWNKILEKWPLEPGLEVVPDDSLPAPSLKIKFLVTDKDFEVDSVMGNDDLIGKVSKNLRITASDHFQDVRHIELHVSNAHHLYNSGDILVLRPQNDIKNVQKIIELLGLKSIADKPFAVAQELAGYTVPAHWPKVITLKHLFTFHLDICGKPRRHFFQLLSFFATSEQHSERLKELASPEGQDDLFSYCYSPKRTILEVLSDFPCSIPLDYLFDLIPEMKPRSFSISSSPMHHLNYIHLTVAIIDFKTIMKERRKGVCTSWISSWELDTNIQFKIEKGTLHLTDEVNTPVILIGPGTGIAPIRSFLHERLEQGATDNALFFGCRHSSADFLYREELENAVKLGKLRLFTAFSRDQESKIYVQDLLLEQKDLIWDWINNRQGCIFISGNSKIPLAINDCLLKIFQMNGLDIQESTSFLKYLEKSGRIQSETWS